VQRWVACGAPETDLHREGCDWLGHVGRLTGGLGDVMVKRDLLGCDFRSGLPLSIGEGGPGLALDARRGGTLLGQRLGS
jgi:hypothetical protein